VVRDPGLFLAVSVHVGLALPLFRLAEALRLQGFGLASLLGL
jgi:hypothetical protein